VAECMLLANCRRTWREIMLSCGSDLQQWDEQSRGKNILVLMFMGIVFWWQEISEKRWTAAVSNGQNAR